MFRCYVLDNHNFAKPEDRAYIRESPERMFHTSPPLEPTDPLFDWINRGFDLYGLYGGVCKDPRLRPSAA